ncbi:MAG: cysteine--tRNA ligase [Flammeovirgaceae bacterium]|jgi:cysteinyl-tRNA synthetase|nr:cysteine--tRNA ligase [Flammeovirgaceae bacterium]
MIKLFNSLSKKKEIFKAIEPGKVKMYVCGMTVYDFCHLGHARVLIVFDLINRWFKVSGYDVIYVRNITDIDDKIIARAAEQGIPFGDLTQKFIDEMNTDAYTLGVISPDIEPRATESIGAMIAMIQTLLEKNFAYIGANNDVFYAVTKFDGYGKLSGKSLEDLRAGNRVEVDKFKKNSFDFVLWKSAKPGEPSWDSPWGKGRPGWHIECSAMSNKFLGKNFDIHGGGQDLQFPHHENEIAQSEASNDCQMANYWLHNGFVRVDDEKMSKSLGNFFTIREILKHYDPEVVRFFVLKAQYRSPLNYSDHHLEDAKQGLTRLYLAIRESNSIIDQKIDWKNSFACQFKDALDDDFNTPEAISVLFSLANAVNKNRQNEEQTLLIQLANILGILEMEPEVFLRGNIEADDKNVDIDQLINDRLEAKKNKDYQKADEIRIFLEGRDILLEDTPNGTIWRKK